MRHAANCSGHFYGISPVSRDAKVRALASLINKPVFCSIDVTLDVPGFREVIEPEYLKAPFNNPYFLGFHLGVQAVAEELLDRGISEPFEMFFDEHPSLGRRVRAWYPITRKLVAPEIRAILPTEPLFRNDEKVLPLQAADMLAWLCRRNADNEAHDFGWFWNEISDLRISAHSMFIDKERMQKWLATSHDPATEITDEEWDADSDLLGPDVQ